MTRHAVTLTMQPVPPAYAAVYTRRGMVIPDGSTPHHWGALVPYVLRSVHQWIASTNGFFWLPCPVCSRPFGGHEIGASVLDEQSTEDGPEMRRCICPSCTAQMNGGTP